LTAKEFIRSTNPTVSMLGPQIKDLQCLVLCKHAVHTATNSEQTSLFQLQLWIGIYNILHVSLTNEKPRPEGNRERSWLCPPIHPKALPGPKPEMGSRSDPISLAGQGLIMPKQTEQYSRTTAYHEAGHAVVAWSFGLPVVAISVAADDASGGAQIGVANHLDLTKQIAVAAAGYTAENVFGDAAHYLAPIDDYDRIRKLLEDNGVAEGPEAQTLRLKGANLADEILRAHEAKVIRLAEKLAQNGSVDGIGFLRLMR
jgi:hypothetical protein